MKTNYFTILLGFLILVMFTTSSYSQAPNVRITGTDAEYANKPLVLYTYTDPLTMEREKLDSCTANAKGDYSFNFYVQEVQQVFVLAGIYKATLYAQPNSSYITELPPYKQKNAADSLNPYFEEKEIYMPLLNADKNELNTVIRRFDDVYYNFLNNNFVDIYHRKNVRKVNDLSRRADSVFADVKNPFFSAYKYYRFAYLQHLAFERNSKYVLKKYFAAKPVSYNNVAYIDLLTKVTERYLSSFAAGNAANMIRSSINNSRSIKALQQAQLSDTAITNDTLREYVLIKGLFDAFYESSFDKNGIIIVFDSLQHNTTNDYHRQIITRILQRITRLQAGFAPPHFELPATNDSIVSLQRFKGKFVYLNFQSVQSYSCQQDLTVLKTFADKYKDYLEIVTICTDNDFAPMKNLSLQQGYKWTILHYASNSKVLKDYDVRGFPSYYLIDPDGKLKLSPALAPTDEFEAQFFNIYTIWRRDSLRNGTQPGVKD